MVGLNVALACWISLSRTWVSFESSGLIGAFGFHAGVSPFLGRWYVGGEADLAFRGRELWVGFGLIGLSGVRVEPGRVCKV